MPAHSVAMPCSTAKHASSLDWLLCQRFGDRRSYGVHPKNVGKCQAPVNGVGEHDWLPRNTLSPHGLQLQELTYAVMTY